MTGISSDNQQRYCALLASAQSSDGLWIAECDGVALILANESGEALIPVWPSENAVRECLALRPEFQRFQPAHRSLDRWLGNSTPHLAADGVFVAAYPDEQLNCLRVPATSFARDLCTFPSLQGKDISRIRNKLERARDGKQR